MREIKTFKKNVQDINQVGIGFRLPFNDVGVFSLTYSTQEQIKYNLVNLLLTNKGEKLSDPNFGCDLYNFLFEPNTQNIRANITNSIRTSTSLYLPQIDIRDIQFDQVNDEIIISVSYIILNSGVDDNVTITIN